MKSLFYPICLSVFLFEWTWCDKISAQSDSITDRKYEITIGMPMLPLFYNNEYAGIFGDESNPPALLYVHGQELWEDQFYLRPELTFSFKTRLSAKHKLISGVIYSKPYSNRYPDFYFFFYQGIEQRLSKPNRRFVLSAEYALFVGHNYYSYYYGATCNHCLGILKEGRVFLIGPSAGINMQYHLTPRLYLGSETSIMLAYGKGKAILEDRSVYPWQDVRIKFWNAGIIFNKFLSVNLGYKL